MNEQMQLAAEVRLTDMNLAQSIHHDSLVKLARNIHYLGFWRVGLLEAPMEDWLF